ncbi:MAG: DUF2062 domain-containing protein [Candidatus Sulfobium sp.]
MHRFKAGIRQILSVNEPPARVATAFAVGVFIGMSPFLGIHTVLGLALAWQFKLNKFVTLIGVYVTNPWTIVPIYSFGTWVGVRVMGLDNVIPAIDWSHITFLGFFENFRPLLIPFLVGSLLVGSIAAVISYMTIYRLARKNRG